MIETLKNLSEYKSILCLDGTIRCDIIKKIDLPVVAADGAANTLISSGIEPYITIGDLDSVDANLLIDRNHLRIESQENTDFEKALAFMEGKSLLPAIIIGMDGGCLDHVLSNMGIFSRTKCLLISGEIIGFMVDGYKTMSVSRDAKISIFGMPECTISSSGLKWELRNLRLSLTGQSSCSNRAASGNLKLDVSDGNAIVFIHTKSIHDAGSSALSIVRENPPLLSTLDYTGEFDK